MDKRSNKYFAREKELIRLKKEDEKNSKAIRNQSLVELDEPIHYGYNAEWVLRKDILNRNDAHVYQEALDACKGKIWSKNKDFKYKSRKTNTWHVAKPKLFKINTAKYEKLSLSARKFFHEFISPKKNYFHKDKTYVCTLSFELEVKITKYYITHKKEHDGVLYQIDDDIEKAMYRAAKNGNPWGSRRDMPKWYRKWVNKKEKLVEERKIVETKKTYKGDAINDLLDI